MNLEKLRKQTKKNWKREMRSEYKRIMWKTKITISSAINNWCTVDIRPESHFAAWLVAANTLSEVKDLCEYGNDIYDSDTHTYIIGTRFKREDSFNRNSHQKYCIKEIGTTNKYKEPTIIISSFLAAKIFNKI